MKQIISKNRVVIGFVFLAVMPLMFSCVRQKDCEYGLPSKFVYLSEPYMSDGHKIVAHSYDMDGRDEKMIFGNVPKAYQTGDTIDVMLFLKRDWNGGWVNDLSHKDYYNIICIERN
ncbi:MAG: hypothetical protein MJZ87_10525 [Bacteroidales bacterium]|nr:hypothetical protein [Bacteroidales bacterium]